MKFRKKNKDLIRKAVLLSWFTVAYNIVEGVVSIALGISDESVALAGFGADSFIEVASALLVLWRFRGEVGDAKEISLERERRATLGIGILFMLLAVGTVAASGFQLFNKSHPETTLPGMVIAALSLSFMFYLWQAKLKVGHALDSSTVLKDAACSLACIKLSVVLLLGSVVYLLLPQLWWTDSAAALLLSIFIGKEGWETIEAARKEDFDGGGCGCSH